ncbi:pilus assembly protein TadG-related protein [Microterricola viridarii]|uniref:pilus assembly protein TadG-related protein n=1 Tax=Microterricola viridarii TaxID=412690 RepID=UPI0009E6BF8E|nr:pilus assembly protein TadG-related protein [Microterricola viridarii]
MTGRLRGEDGSSLILTIFYGAFALVLILLVVAATSLSLERKRLLSVADGAALAGAEAFELSAVHLTPGGLTVAVSDVDVRAAALEHLAAVPHGSLEDLRVEHAGSPDGASALVTLSAWWRPPVLTVFVPEGIRLEVSSTARSMFR